MFRCLFQILLLVMLSGHARRPAVAQDQHQERPNIVLMFPDNLGWGEVGAYGGVRGIPTPTIDRIADEGIRRVMVGYPPKIHFRIPVIRKSRTPGDPIRGTERFLFAFSVTSSSSTRDVTEVLSEGRRVHIHASNWLI